MKKFSFIMLGAAVAAATVSCSDSGDEPGATLHTVVLENSWPADFNSEEADVSSARLTFTELNTGEVYNVAGTDTDALGCISLPTGTYDYAGEIGYRISLDNGEEKSMLLRAAGQSVTVAGDCSLRLEWFMSVPSQGFVISEIYAAGSFNAAHTGGLRDTYIRICNNSDEVLYADGMAIVESDFVNSRSNDYTVLTSANDRNANFTVGVVYVIPGSGSDVSVAPGESIVIADQAVDWGAQVAGALDLTGANFEWYDDVAQDTDNPSVPNLDKWFSYSSTIWMISNQCSRSYAIVKFPEGMTAEKYLAEYKGGYDYIHPATNRQMRKEKAYLIPNTWIVDGVNLSNREVYVRGALAASIDASYASISDRNSDPLRFGKAFVRKTAAVRADGRVILQDTDNSAADFTLSAPRL